MGELRAQVDVVGPPFDGVEVLAERFPRPLDPLVEHRARNVLHTLHQRNETVVRIGSHRCEAHAAVAHDGGRHAMPARRRHAGVPGGLPVVVRVDVDEPRSDQQPRGIDLLAASLGDRSDCADGGAVHGDVGRDRLAAQPVCHVAAPDDQIVWHVPHPFPVARRDS